MITMTRGLLTIAVDRRVRTLALGFAVFLLSLPLGLR